MEEVGWQGKLKGGATVDVRGQITKMIEAVVMLPSLHVRALTGIARRRIPKKRYARHPRRQLGRLRIRGGRRDESVDVGIRFLRARKA